MKRFNCLFITLLVACLALSFVAPNNLDEKQAILAANFTSSAVTTPQKLNADTVSYEELQEFVSKKLLKPVRECMEKHDPNVFMTKCYSKLTFDLSPRQRRNPIYTHAPIKGILTYIECSEDYRMADIFIDYNTKEITVRESFKTPAQDLKSYLDDVCNYIDKNGLPSKQ